MKKLPCPRCGKTKRLSVKQMSRMLNPREWEAGWEVQCDNCCMSSGMAQTKEKAVEVWNSLPRLPQWTTETPTEPGWYWHRGSGVVSILSVNQLFLEILKNRDSNIEFAGPIPEPQEPQR